MNKKTVCCVEVNCFDLIDNLKMLEEIMTEPRHEVSNNVVCAASKASDQRAHMRSLIKAFASRLNTCQNTTLLEITCRGSCRQICRQMVLVT